MVIHNGEPRGETGRLIPWTERRVKKKKKTERQKDESSLRSLTHCQIVNVKAHNYT